MSGRIRKDFMASVLTARLLVPLVLVVLALALIAWLLLRR